MSATGEEEERESVDDAPAPEESEQTPEEWLSILRELAISVLVVFLIAGILFSISGVWPPLVAVESESMEPQIMTGDLVFIIEPDRFAGEHTIDGTGVVPADRSADHESFDRPGDVIIFAPNGDVGTTPIIHRAHLWVDEDENWYDRADPDLMRDADDCDELPNCPAPNAGFITHGDNNEHYDQVQRNSRPVQGDWVIARAWLRVPWVGHIRLILGDVFAMAIPLGLAGTAWATRS